MLNPVAPFRVAWRERNLRLLLAGLATSQAGDWLYNLALLAFVYERTHSSMWVGLTTAVRILPEVALGSVGGVLADRVDRRALMLTSDAVRALTMAALALAAVAHAPVVLAPVLAAVSTAAGSVYPPCVVAVLPRIATDEQLPAANAARVSVTFICVVAGPLFGAALLVLGSAALAFAVNGVTFLLGGLVVSALPREALRRPAPVDARDHVGLVREIQTGWHALRGYRDGMIVAGANLVASGVYGALTVLLVLYAQRLGLGSAGYGYLLAAAGAGAVLSAGVAQHAAGSHRSRRALGIALVAVGAPLPLLAAGASLPVAILLIAVIGGGSIVTEVVGDTCLQRELDPAVFGRAYGLLVPAYVGAIAVGALLTPVFVTAFGLSATFVGLGFSVVAYGAFVGGRRRARRLATRIRRVAVVAAMTIGLAAAGASVANAATASPNTPVQVDAAGVARLLFVAGDVGRVSQIPSGTEAIVLEKVLQQLYVENPTLAPAQAVSEIQALQSVLGSGSAATSPATLTVMAGNQRVLAILRALTDSNPPADVLHALAQVSDQALTGASDSTAGGLGQVFNASADSLDTLAYSGFSAAQTLAGTASLAAANHQFGAARDTLWRQDSHESVFDDAHTLVSENPVLQSSAVQALLGLVAGDGTLTTTVGRLESLINSGVMRENDQNCTLATGSSGGSASDCTAGALHDAQLVAQQCPDANATSAACQSARNQAQSDAAGELSTIAEQQAATAAEADALGYADQQLQSAEIAQAEAAARINDEENQYLYHQSVQGYEKAGFDVANLVVALSVSEVDPVAAFGGLLNVVGDAVGFSFSGPDPNTIILDGLKNVSQQVASFENYTQSAFHALDRQLSDLSSQVARDAAQLSVQLTQVQGQLKELASHVGTLQDSVDHLQSEIQSLFASTAWNELVTVINQNLGYQKLNVGPYSQAQFAAAAGALYTDATKTAVSATLVHPPANFDALSAKSLLVGTDPLSLDTNINYFNVFGSRVTDASQATAPWPATPLTSNCVSGADAGICLPDPDFWAASARAFAQLLAENPGYVTPSQVQRLNTVEQEGQLISDALHRLSANDAGTDTSGTGNQTLDAAIDYYKSWGRGTHASGPPTLPQALHNEEQSYLETTNVKSLGIPYYPIDPWGGINQNPDLNGLLSTDAFTKVALCSGDASELGLDPNNYLLPGGLTPDLVSFLPRQVLNAARLGVGQLTTCWYASGSTEDPGANDFTIGLNYYYSAPGVNETVGSLQLNTLAYFCPNQALTGNVKLDAIHMVADRCNPVTTWLAGPTANKVGIYKNDVADYAEPAVYAALGQLQSGIYQDILSNGSTLTIGTSEATDVADAANRLAGANAILNGYISLGLPQSLAADDTLHSLVAGQNADAFAPTDPNENPWGVAPADSVPDQVVNFYRAALNAKPSFDPADQAAALVNLRASELRSALRPHIVGGSAGGSAQAARIQLAAGITAQSPSTAFAEDNALIAPTLDRLSETQTALTDTINHGASLYVSVSGAGAVSGSGVSCPGTCSHNYAPGTSVTLTAIPASGEQFTGWTGACSGTGTCTVLLDYDQQVGAMFAPGGSSGTPATPATPTVPAAPAAPTVQPAGHGTATPGPVCTLRPLGNAVLLSVPKTKKGKAAQAKPGVVTLRVSCDQSARVTINGRVRIVTGKRPHQRVQTLAVAPVTVVVKPGHATTVAVKLPAAAIAALGRKAQVSASFSGRAVGATGSGTTGAVLRTVIGKRM